MQSIGLLVCGHPSATHGSAKIALDQLRASIERFSKRAADYLAGPPTEDTFSFGPFCARVLLENACAALVGRLDSFRLLYLCEFQSQPEYEPGKRAKSAFSWSGDIIPDDKGPPNLWSTDHETLKISRALFSKHVDHVYWRPAVEMAVDFAAQQPANPVILEIASLDAENFINQVKGAGSQLYSTLSKGVHWEFFTSALMFDETTVKNCIRETLVLISRLAFISHFIPTAYASLPPADAVAQYIDLRSRIV